MRLRALLGFGVMTVMLACSASKESTSGPGTLAGGDTGTGFDLDAGNDGDPDSNFNTGEGGTGSCAATSYKAEVGFAPVDIIWVVDSSGSMDDEAKRVQDNLNGFSTSMGMAGIDWHVVMITASSFVSVPPPLGTSPNYKLIDRQVGSNEPLQALLDEFPNYVTFLRPLAITHIVAVTDDESSIKAEDFYAQMQKKLGKNFKVHAIASEKVAPTFTNPEGACQTGGFGNGAAAPGIEYYRLADATKGLKFSICTTDWTGLFKTLTAEVAAPARLPCAFILPAESTADPMKVNIEWSKGNGEKETLLYVGDGGAAACNPGGWYYDDPVKPTRAILCPSTCTAVSGDTAGTIAVALGCATRIK